MFDLHLYHNLSFYFYFQVIPRKDLPRIYTMCLPRAYQQAASGDQSTDDDQNLGQGLADLDNTREEVLKEVIFSN